MSAFAAGCAICGADLEAHRRRLSARPTVGDATRRLPEIPAPHLSARLNPDIALVAVTALMLLISPLLGAILAALGAWDRDRNGRSTMRNVFLVLLGLGVAGFFTPWQYGVLSLLF